ncbi:MAG: tripartite tricarboxylate transporter substrate binding protein [Burkholderiaceae bacterium]|nr:tripartite tricarboxylate transporter substrate binding protein [Burkholderiaceae bacterium]
MIVRSSALPRRRLLAGLALAASAPAWAQTEAPAGRPITLINPYAAGGPADALARALAQQLSTRLKQTVIVDSKAGGAATIGTGFVARARPDGHTLLLGTSAGHVVTPLMQRVPYDGVADFAFIGVVASQPNVLVVHADLGLDSVAALLARARKEPGALNYASAGAGGATHLGAEAFAQKAQIRITHVPYSGAAPALKDLLGGQVQMGMLNLAATKPHIDQGRLKALAYGGRQRSPLLPNTPTLAEAGMGGAELSTWYTLAAPKGTPPEVVERLHAALSQVQQDPAWLQFLAAQGAERLDLSPRETSAFVQADKAAMSRLLASLNLLER